MTLNDLTSREAVEAALDEFDAVGREAFLNEHGFGPSNRFFVRRNGALYDSEAIAGVAYGYQHPERGPLRSSDFSGGEHTVKPLLEQLGFEVIEADMERPPRVDRTSAFAAQGGVREARSGRVSPCRACVVRGHDRGGGRVGSQVVDAELVHEPRRLNVGSVGTLTVDGAGISIALIGDVLSDEERQRLEELGSFTGGPGSYKSIPAAIDYRCPASSVEPVTEITAAARSAYIRAAVDDMKVSRFQSAFSGGALSYLREATGRDLPDPGFLEPLVESRAWIFQANPDIYDIDRALRARDSIQFTVRQNKRRVKLGDRAYIWRAGPEAGIVATGSIKEGPAELAPDPAENAFFRRPEEFANVEPRVNIAIDAVVDPPLLRSVIAADDTLSELTILHFRNATVFGLSPGQAERLAELVGVRQRRFWWVNQGESYSQARAGGYISAPLADKSGATPAHWRTMRDLDVGDLVLHYANGSLRAIGEVTATPVETDPNDPIGADLMKATVAYRDLEPPLPLGNIPERWRISEGGPFNRNGGVNQGYLYPLSDEFISQLARQFPQLALTPPAVSRDRQLDRPELAEITERIHSFGLRIDEAIVRRYHTSLQTRGFVVLTGISGTGKTWLAETYARLVGAKLLIVPVAPNWTTNEDLLGYLNPLDGTYHDTEFSLFLKEAAAAYASAANRDGQATDSIWCSTR